jgi:chromatin segregation and condensation protein Rec8/ScpA/Scc1 (kleisin family)
MTKEEEDDDDEEIIIERLQRERERRKMNVERLDEKEEDKEDSFLSDEEKNENRQKRRLKSFTMPANATKDFIFQSGRRRRSGGRGRRITLIEKSLAPRRKFQIEKTNTKKDGFRDNSRRNDEKAF